MKAPADWLGRAEEIRRLYALGKSRTFELVWAVCAARESNVQTFERLPAEWSILYELSRLDLATIQKLTSRDVSTPQSPWFSKSPISAFLLPSSNWLIATHLLSYESTLSERAC